jgi:tripartite-type tricarboxylate transporter receptor subunit TctC
MKFPRRKFLHLAAGAAALPVVSRSAWAQTAYPTRPITLIVPYPAGGPVDAAARVVVERMRRSLGQTIIIENIGGAEGSIGTGRVARSPPDGYTIELGNLATHVLNGALYSLSYDILNDFAPVAMLGSTPYVLFAKKTMQASNLSELIAWLKINSDKASVGHRASSVVKLVEVVFQKQTGTKFTVVPYRGAAPAMQDLVAGQIDLVFSNPPFLSLVRDEKIKAFAVTSDARLQMAKEIPSFAELGLPTLSYSAWQGFFAPKGTPKGIIDRLNAATVESMADPSVKSRLVELGYEVVPREQQTPEVFAALVKADAEKYWPIIKEFGIKP